MPWPRLTDPKRRAEFLEFCAYLLFILMMPLFQIGLMQIVEWLR